jgi:hypothetical protein
LEGDKWGVDFISEVGLFERWVEEVVVEEDVV